MPVLPIPNPMDEVRGGIFIRFAEVLVRCLCFHFSPYVVHAVSKNHFKLGTWAVTKIQTLPVVRVPRTTGREKRGRMGGYSPPTPQPGCRLVAMA